MKNLFFGIAVLSVFAVASAASCTDETSGDGGAGGTSDGGNGTGATGATGGAGGTGGGSTGCASCYDFVEATLAGTPFDTSTMCGYDADPVDPTSSYGLLLELGACTCDPAVGMCDTVCEETCTGSGMDMDPDCGMCQQSAAIGGACNAEFNACSADVDGTGE